MQHVIIGTAGHIDHGKTTLIKAMTGRDTDTLKEEKDRGISINLGFTYFDLPSGRRAGIIDVPGHEKFIKNMLAGIGGIDLVLLVIAADEGIMPQTREHLNILKLLDIKKGIIVVTKKDMVDEEWLEMIKEEIKKEMNGTFLKDAPIIPVASITGEGIKELTMEIDMLTAEIGERDTLTDFRVPIDRVFTISGFGTVVTGTLISGKITEGDSCEIYPKGVKTKIRNIQVHDKNVEDAYAGQRVAINLANIKTDQVERGDVLSKVDSMQSSLMIDCRLNYLNDAPRPLKNRDRVRVYHGTSELLGRVMLIDKDVVNPGETALIQVRLESEISAKSGDKYVIRSYSPLFTIGGGTILEANPAKHRAGDAKVIEQLQIREKGSPKDIIEQTIRNLSSNYPKLEDITKLIGKGMDNIEEIIESLVLEGRIVKIRVADGTIFVHQIYMNLLKNKSQEILEGFHAQNPLKAGMSREEFKNKVFGADIKQKLYDKFLEILSEDTINVAGSLIHKKGFTIKFSPELEKIKEQILNTFSDSGLQPPKPEDIIKNFGRSEKAAKTVFDCLVDLGLVIKIADEIYVTKPNLDMASGLLVDFIKNNNDITAAQFRDTIGVSRKYAVALLEYFDSIKLTRRLEDKRILL